MTKRLVVMLLSCMMLFSAHLFFFAENMSAYADADVDSWAALGRKYRTEAHRLLRFPAISHTTERALIPEGGDTQLPATANSFILLYFRNTSRCSLSKKAANLTIDQGVTLSAKTDLQGCPERTTYTFDKFTGDLSADGQDLRAEGTLYSS